jgi:hypothetical protein
MKKSIEKLRKLPERKDMHMFQGSHNSGRRAGVLIAALFFSCTTALMGQMFLGSVVGLVTDSSGAVVPQAKVQNS